MLRENAIAVSQLKDETKGRRIKSQSKDEFLELWNQEEITKNEVPLWEGFACERSIAKNQTVAACYADRCTDKLVQEATWPRLCNSIGENNNLKC